MVNESTTQSLLLHGKLCSSSSSLSRYAIAPFSGSLTTGVKSQTFAIEVSPGCIFNVCEYEKNVSERFSFVYEGEYPLLFLPYQKFDEQEWCDGEIIFVDGSESWTIVPHGIIDLTNYSAQKKSSYRFQYEGLTDEVWISYLLESAKAVLKLSLLSVRRKMVLDGEDLSNYLVAALWARVERQEPLQGRSFVALDKAVFWSAKSRSHFKHLFMNDLQDVDVLKTSSLRAIQLTSHLSLEEQKSLARELNLLGDLVPRSII